MIGGISVKTANKTAGSILTLTGDAVIIVSFIVNALGKKRSAQETGTDESGPEQACRTAQKTDPVRGGLPEHFRKRGVMNDISLRDMIYGLRRMIYPYGYDILSVPRGTESIIMGCRARAEPALNCTLHIANCTLNTTHC